MRAIWKGAISFGLVNVPVRLFSATQEHDLRLHQVHRTDGGRIRMHRMCSICGEEVAYDHLGKAFESSDGRLVVLDEEDLARLSPLTGKQIDVVEFVPAAQVDPILLNRAYYLEPEARAVTPYTLLREALTATDRMAVVRIALRQRESMAVLRVRDDVIVLQTLLWPDEVRSARFDVLDQEVRLRPQELDMAESLVESLTADFEPERFEDRYAKALTSLVDAGLTGAEPAPDPENRVAAPDFVDLLTALEASVEQARAEQAKAGQAKAGQARSQQARAAGAEKPPASPTRGRATSTTPDASPPGRRPSAKAAPTAKRSRTTKTTTAAKTAKTANETTPAEKGTAKKTTSRKTPAKAPRTPAPKPARKATPSRRRSA